MSPLYWHDEDEAVTGAAWTDLRDAIVLFAGVPAAFLLPVLLVWVWGAR